MATDKTRKKIAKGRHASTIKRDRQNEKRRARNRHELSKVKTMVKGVRSTGTKESLEKAVPALAKAAQKGIIHRRKAARLISRLTKAVHAHSA